MRLLLQMVTPPGLRAVHWPTCTKARAPAGGAAATAWEDPGTLNAQGRIQITRAAVSLCVGVLGAVFFTAVALMRSSNRRPTAAASPEAPPHHTQGTNRFR